MTKPPCCLCLYGTQETGGRGRPCRPAGHLGLSLPWHCCTPPPPPGLGSQAAWHGARLAAALGQQGGASGGSAEDVAGRPGFTQRPSPEARARKVRAPRRGPSGRRVGTGRAAGGGAGRAGLQGEGGCTERAQSRAVPGPAATSRLAFLLPSLPPPPGPAEGRPREHARGPGRNADTERWPWAEEGPARRGPGLSRRKTSQGLQIAVLSFFFFFF